MSARATTTTLQRRFLPHGPLDLVRQVLLFMAAYQLYRLTRGFVNDPDSATVAFNHARELIGVERTLNVFIEPSVQAFTAGQTWLLDIASWMYINAQTSITLSALIWFYLFRNASFYFVRNMFLFAFCLALVGYGLFPTAPPRFLPEWGFFDAVSDFTGVPQDSVTVDALFNPYAAMPSMHVGFALMISIPLVRLVKWRALKVFWSIYPLIVVWVIVSTANHFILDAFFGAVTAGIGALFALAMARLRPEVWAFRPPERVAALERRHVAPSTA
jgi:PAP2 superfamily